MKHIGHDRFWKEVEAGTWEPETFKVLHQYIKPNKTFIDIGSWNGVCSLYAYELGAICHAIEPDNEAFAILSANIALNSADIKSHNLCISDKNGIEKINTQYVNGFGNSMSSLVNRGIIEGEQEVKSLTLDAFLATNSIHIGDICLIKIDIEGGEINLLKQAKEFIGKYKPTIYISLHPSWFPDLDNDLASIESIMFNGHKVYDPVGNEINKDDFKELVLFGVHSFVMKK